MLTILYSIESVDSWRDRIQLHVGVEIILDFKILMNIGTKLSTLSMGQSVGALEIVTLAPGLRRRVPLILQDTTCSVPLILQEFAQL